MKPQYDPKVHRRRSIRLSTYDYRQSGAYFVTICTQGRELLFGDVVDGKMRSNDAGRMVQAVWHQLPDHYPGVDVDAFVVMPNHVHGVILLIPDRAVGAPHRGCPNGGSPDDGGETGQAQGPAPTMDGDGPVGAPHRGCPGSGCANHGDKGTNTTPRLSLPDVVHRFKSFTTTQYRHGVLQRGWPPFRGRVWQRNYYEHIIRNNRALNAVRQYIADNPARWEWDTYNPVFAGPDPQTADL